MNKFRHTIIPAVYLILEKEDKILFLKRMNTGHEDGNYSLVAGHIDDGESPTQALVREAKEEAGIGIDASDLHFCNVLYRREIKEDGTVEQRVDFFFSTHIWTGEVRNMEPEKCGDLSWFALDRMPENVVSYVKTALSHYRNGLVYSEFGW